MSGQSELRSKSRDGEQVLPPPPFGLRTATSSLRSPYCALRTLHSVLCTAYCVLRTVYSVFNRISQIPRAAFRAPPPDLPPVLLVDMGFAVSCPLAPHRRPPHPVLVHRLAPLIHASFRPRLATTPLRFSSPSPPPGRTGDFHPQAVEHVRHTTERAGRKPAQEWPNDQP